MSAMTAPPATVAFSEPSVTVRASEKESAVAGRSEGREPGPSVGSQLAEKLSGADQAMNVLVVEDDKSTRVIVESLLVSCGHSVVTATNGKEALELLASQEIEYDLILTDIMMPEVDGMELMRVVHENERLREIPIIIMSTTDSDDMVAKCTRAGAQDYLVKPVNKAAVKDLQRHVKGASTRGLSPASAGTTMTGGSTVATAVTKALQGSDLSSHTCVNGNSAGLAPAGAMERWASGASGTCSASASASASREGSGSGSGGGIGGGEPKVEGLSVQLVKAHGGATTMLELSLPRPSGDADKGFVGLRRSASRSAFQTFLKAEEAKEAQVVSLKVDKPESLASLTARFANGAPYANGVGDSKISNGASHPPNGVAPADPATLLHHAHSGGLGMPHPAAFPPPPAPPGVDPIAFAAQMRAAVAGAGAPGAPPPPPGVAPTGAPTGTNGPPHLATGNEFVSQFYSVLQSAVDHQQQASVRLGADGRAGAAERRAEAISRFLKKRKERNFEKKVRYASRKRLAEARPRVRGQFVRLKDEAPGGGGGGKEDEGESNGSAQHGSNEGSKDGSGADGEEEQEEEEEAAE